MVHIKRDFLKNKTVKTNNKIQHFRVLVTPLNSLNPLLAKVFMSHIKENFEQEDKLPSFYRRYVDDTLTAMPKIETASNFLNTLNKAHSSVKFSMETKCNGILPFLGVQLLNQSTQREKGGLKTHQFRSTLALSESCRQLLRRGLTENYAQLREY